MSGVVIGSQLSKPLPTGEAAGDWFGHRVSIKGTTAIVGAPGVDERDDSECAAYVSDVSHPLHPLLDARRVAADGDTGVEVGISVAMRGQMVIAGAWLDDDKGTNSGSACLFDALTGEQLAELLPVDGAAGDPFWIAGAIGDCHALVGAMCARGNGGKQEAAYPIDSRSGRQLVKLETEDDGVEDLLGWSVSLNGEQGVIGAPYRSVAGYRSGAACLPDASDSSADVSGDGELDFSDFVAFQLLWQEQDSAAGCDVNAEFNVLDFDCFQGLLQAGFP